MSLLVTLFLVMINIFNSLQSYTPNVEGMLPIIGFKFKLKQWKKHLNFRHYCNNWLCYDMLGIHIFCIVRICFNSLPEICEKDSEILRSYWLQQNFPYFGGVSSIVKSFTDDHSQWLGHFIKNKWSRKTLIHFKKSSTNG